MLVLLDLSPAKFCPRKISKDLPGSEAITINWEASVLC